MKGEYHIVFRFGIQSFLNYYSKVFSNVALERLTGINLKLLHHYTSGLRTSREAQRKKIENALHKLGKELLTVKKRNFYSLTESSADVFFGKLMFGMIKQLIGSSKLDEFSQVHKCHIIGYPPGLAQRMRH